MPPTSVFTCSPTQRFPDRQSDCSTRTSEYSLDRPRVSRPWPTLLPREARLGLRQLLCGQLIANTIRAEWKRPLSTCADGIV